MHVGDGWVYPDNIPAPKPGLMDFTDLNGEGISNTLSANVQNNPVNLANP